ncbi:MAG TPA: ATP-binding cassette domain-containing protein [Desulfobacterales bacterium]|nr:ATP-binding cassette domain-containing protein [Desulfobacterales bacterium]
MIVVQGSDQGLCGIKAIDRLDPEVHSGGTFGFLGHNGAGKIVTVCILITLTKSTSGHAWINGSVCLRAGKTNLRGNGRDLPSA